MLLFCVWVLLILLRCLCLFTEMFGENQLAWVPNVNNLTLAILQLLNICSFAIPHSVAEIIKGPMTQNNPLLLNVWPCIMFTQMEQRK